MMGSVQTQREEKAERRSPKYRNTSDVLMVE